jgi:Flp pilus assembly protein TadG
MMLKSMLHRDDKGIGAVEFALVAPVLISFIIGISQVGRLFYANADMKSAAAHAARLASVYRQEGTVDDSTLIAAVKARLMRTGAASKVTVTVVRGTSDGNPYVELRTNYSVPLEFIFFSPPPITLHDTRRVFTQVASGNSTTYTTTTGGTTSTTTTTSASTSATSAGGSTGSTSATSAGGSTGSTSATSASSTTSSSSSGNNASSSGNNGSSGHNHGNCNNKCG